MPASEITKENIAKKETVAGPVECKYPKKDLVANAQAIFKVPPEVVIGALHGNTANEFTVAEVKQAVKKFMNKKVK
ncbi:hypothetical protein SAMN05660649_04265 [Desulfotomaculum arcticum]|uniref:YqzN/YkzM domain-containing protein n=1 Tax=Desulfotruncus arcticus DSM 17038 TaxID=1121424 RepID=A0A1I2Y775_9FIRM|nr:hypothetical protein [Desulfotruncus arcticus]SFH21227.1 hypothetical protein SAMN05660649_04265 [Desulfotomaculum arcticum] [Desulfotruncus arcticus DSM 17038]